MESSNFKALYFFTLVKVTEQELMNISKQTIYNIVEEETGHTAGRSGQRRKDWYETLEEAGRKQRRGYHYA